MAKSIPSTMTEQVNQVEKLSLSYRVLHPNAKVKDVITGVTIEIPYVSIVRKYRDYIAECEVERELTDEEQAKYWFKPKLFSYDTYGTVELWDTLLLLNNCKSVIDFKPVKITYYDPDYFKTYLNECMLIEESLGNGIS